jgi:hypothetical protein
MTTNYAEFDELSREQLIDMLLLARGTATAFHGVADHLMQVLGDQQLGDSLAIVPIA